MKYSQQNHDANDRPRCCPCGHHGEGGITRRGFIGSTAALGGVALTGLSWTALAEENHDANDRPKRKPLTVKPIFCYSLPEREEKASWRKWGGVQTRQDAEKEIARINRELAALKAAADFPVEFLPLHPALEDLESLGTAKSEAASADVTLIYAAGGGMALLHGLVKTAKNPLIFCRHRSGPVSTWYENISPRYLRRSTDRLVRKRVSDDDVVIDDQDELLRRLRALCGLANTVGAKVLAVGGPSGWSWAYTDSPDRARERFELDIQTVSYDELAELIKQARADKTAVAAARRRADEYLGTPGTTLETERKFVDNAFLLERIFRGLLKKADCRALTINNCMGTIMDVAETTACLPLSTLNDDGYLAFCEADFVVIPAGMLLGNISGKPQFMNDPTYPHKGVITLAHCTGPRKMDGRREEPVRILTHYESDYGAATKVEMPKGQKLTNLIADFEAKRYLGVRGEIIDSPFLPICRDQIDVRIDCDSRELARRMPGFHWITCYGDYMRECEYALNKLGIEWDEIG